MKLYVPFPAFLSRDRSKKSNFERSIESSDLCRAYATIIVETIGITNPD